MVKSSGCRPCSLHQAHRATFSTVLSAAGIPEVIDAPAPRAGPGLRPLEESVGGPARRSASLAQPTERQPREPSAASSLPLANGCAAKPQGIGDRPYPLSEQNVNIQR